jgi:hypothetical protein
MSYKNFKIRQERKKSSVIEAVEPIIEAVEPIIEAVEPIIEAKKIKKQRE